MAPLPPLMAAAIGCASTLAATLVPGALVPPLQTTRHSSVSLRHSRLSLADN